MGSLERKQKNKKRVLKLIYCHLSMEVLCSCLLLRHICESLIGCCVMNNSDWVCGRWCVLFIYLLFVLLFLILLSLKLDIIPFKMSVRCSFFSWLLGLPSFSLLIWLSCYYPTLYMNWIYANVNRGYILHKKYVVYKVYWIHNIKRGL